MKRHRRNNEETTRLCEKAAALVQSGMSKSEAARQVGINEGSVRRFLKKKRVIVHNVTKKSASIPTQKPESQYALLIVSESKLKSVLRAFQ